MIWEYMQITGTDIKTTCAMYGKQGWEVFAVSDEGLSFVFFLKRKKPA